MASYVHKPIDATSPPDLLNAFTEACERHGISVHDDEAIDLSTVLWHAFRKGVTTQDALGTFVSNLLGK